MPYIEVRINDEKKKFKYARRKDDGRMVTRLNEGQSGYKEDGTPTYSYKYIYAHGELELAKKIKEYIEGVDEKTNFKEFFTKDIVEWVRKEFFNHVKPTTYDRYEQIVLNQIVPEAEKLKHKKIVDISIDDCKEILNNVSVKVSESSYKKTVTLLRAYFDDKVEAGIIARNPARFKIRGSKGRGKSSKVSGITIDEDENPVYLSDEEILKIKDVIENGYYINCKNRSGKEFLAHNKIPQGKYFIFMLNTGLRAGEAVALKYSDIDFENQKMTVRRNITYVKKRDEKGNAIGGSVKVEGSPKTDDSFATVNINKKSIEILKELLAEEPEGYDGYIIHDTRKFRDNSHPVKSVSSNALYKRWQTVCKQAGIPERGLHSLRHSCASHLFAATNGNAVLVSELLRHSDVSFTEKVYIDIIKKYRDSVFEEFEI